ncbi:MAG: hypothetical protein JW982_13655 [Spirochaetes bacterium]|nr:hypothetical protein [Spirochaetota bacterium]
MKFFFISFFCTLFCINIAAVNYSVDYPAVGIIENNFDDITSYLNRYGIAYDMIRYEDLEKPEIYSRYDFIYYPNGIEREINSSIEILARERRIEGVTFNSEFYRIKDEKIAALMRDFVFSGKTVVCSGYSAKFLNEAFDYFILYKDFPNLGLYGYSNVTPDGNLLNYTSAAYSTLMQYDGYWIAEGLKKGEVLLRAECNTPLGYIKTVAGSRVEYSSGGTAYYLSELGSMDKNEIMRYFTVSVLFDGYSRKMKRLVTAWGQKLTDYAVDKNMSFDNGREYKLHVLKEYNTLYGFFEKGVFQVDIYDSGRKLIYSENHVADKFEKTLNFDNDSDIYVRIFTDKDEFGGIVLFGTGSGKRIIPYFSEIRNVSILSIIFAFAVTIIKRRRKYSGKYADVNSGEKNG